MNCKLSKIVAVSLLVVGCVYFSSCGKDEKVELYYSSIAERS